MPRHHCGKRVTSWKANLESASGQGAKEMSTNRNEWGPRAGGNIQQPSGFRLAKPARERARMERRISQRDALPLTSQRTATSIGGFPGPTPRTNSSTVWRSLHGTPVKATRSEPPNPTPSLARLSSSRLATTT